MDAGRLAPFGTRDATEDGLIVDTATLAAALGISPSKVRKLVGEGVITPVERKRRPGRNGRGQPTMWFDLDTATELLDRRSSGCDSP